MQKFLSLLSLVLFIPILAVAQSSEHVPFPSTPTFPPIPLSTPTPKANPNNNKAELKAKTNLRFRYDKFTGMSGWETKLVTVWKPSFAFQFVVDPYVELKVQAFAGKGEETVMGCGLYFYSQSKSWYYLDNSTLAVLANGNRYSFEGKQEGTVGGGLVYEHIFVLIPCDTLSTILKSDPLEMRLGSTEFKVKDKNLKELRMILPVLSN